MALPRMRHDRPFKAWLVQNHRRKRDNGPIVTPGNLLLNSSFENGFDGWTRALGAPNIIEGNPPNSGRFILQMNNGSSKLSQNVAVKAGQRYRYGGRVKYLAGTTIADQNNNKFRIGETTGGIITATNITIGQLTTNSWTYISGTFTGVTSARNIEFSISTALNSVGKMYFDDVFFVEDI